jgi:hypothetical protein
MLCRYAECHYAEYRYAECHYAECHYAEYRYAECHGALGVLLIDKHSQKSSDLQNFSMVCLDMYYITRKRIH